MPPRQERPADDFSAQLRDLQASLDSVTSQQDQFQAFITTQLPDLIREQLNLSTPAFSSTPPPSIKLPKIRLASFDGTNPLEWIFQAESYFSLTETPPTHRLLFIPFFLQGPALIWFKWLHANHLLTTWDEFLRALEIRFGPSSYDNHEAALYKLKQTGSVLEFQQQYEMISNRVLGLSHTSLLNCFLSGLRPDIARELAILRPSSLSQAIDLAKLVESKITDSKPHYQSKPRTTQPPTPTNQPSILGPPINQTPLAHPIKRLTVAEQQERRSKGLCFNCDERFHPGHRCAKKQFLLLLSDEPNLEPENATLPTETEIQTETPPLELTTTDNSPGEHFQLSYAALAGPPSPRTLRVQGYIKEMSVTILVDTGSSHNILQPRVAEFLNLPVVSIPSFSVIVGNGDSITCASFCSDVPVVLAQQLFTIPCYILPIMEQIWS